MNDLSFSFVDVLVVATVVISVIFATYRGFVQETLTVFAWAAAAFAMIYFAPALAPVLRQRISPEWLGVALAYLGIFLVVMIPLSFVSYRFSQGVKHSPVGTLDRSLGFAFGVIRGLAIVGIAYLVFCMAVPIGSQPSWMTRARFLPMIQGSSDVLLSLIPNRHETVAAGPKAPPGTPTPKPAPRAAANSAKHNQKTYGAQDRRELDRLIEATGSGNSAKP